MTEHRPRILVSTNPRQAPWYFQAIEAAGGSAEGGYLPRLSGDFDGLLFCGGGDIEPSRFGQENRGSNPPDLEQDAWEFSMISSFLAQKKPIMGICRGMQVINVALGGDIIQDLPPELAPFHGDGVHFRCHSVRSATGSVFHRLYGPVFPVNSFHHQAVGRPGRGLIPQLWSEGGVVEGMVHESLPILAVQFHPECMTGAKLRPENVDGGPLFSYFLSLF